MLTSALLHLHIKELYIYAGLRNGYGYRDTVQDTGHNPFGSRWLGKAYIYAVAQVDNGGGLPLVKFNHNAGHEDTPDDDSM